MVWITGDGSQAFHDPIRVPRESRRDSTRTPFLSITIAPQRPICMTLKRVSILPRCQMICACNAKKTSGMENCQSCIVRLPWNLAWIYQNSISSICATSPLLPLTMPSAVVAQAEAASRRLVFSYCSTGSPHDQYFFKHPEKMVSGAVTPPRLELTNEDLVRAHVYAIWLAETGLCLGKSLKDLLDVNGDDPTLELLGMSMKVLRTGAKREHERQRHVYWKPCPLSSINLVYRWLAR